MSQMNIYEKLRKYIRSIDPEVYSSEIIKNWAYGAVDFAYFSGIISYQDKERLYSEFSLLED